MGDVKVPGRQLHFLYMFATVCVRLRESKAANRESLCISSMSVGLLGDLKKTGFLSSLSLALSVPCSLSLPSGALLC